MNHATKSRSSSIWEDEDTCRWSVDADLLAISRQQGSAEASTVRRRPEEGRAPSTSAPPAKVVPRVDFASTATIRGIFDAYVRALGPAAKSLFAEELRAIDAPPSRVPQAQVRDLVVLLALRIPAGPARERFVEEALTRFENGGV